MIRTLLIAVLLFAMTGYTNETKAETPEVIETPGMKAARKAGRIATDGILGSKVNGGKGVIVEVNCENAVSQIICVR